MNLDVVKIKLDFHLSTPAPEDSCALCGVRSVPLFLKQVSVQLLRVNQARGKASHEVSALTLTLIGR